MFHVTQELASYLAASSARRALFSEQIPEVAEVQTRVITDATLDVHGLEEPAIGRLISIPSRRVPMLGDLFISRGRYIRPDAADEVNSERSIR